jgi:cellulose 1,4-beta-cellobiosidase
MVVVPDGDLPSDTQIKAGQQSSGAAALASENLPVVGTGTQTFSAVTGLDHSTAYDVWFLHQDAAGNDSIAVLAEFTTAALAAPSPPASVVALGRNESIRVNWSASATAESYSVKWGTVDGGPYGNSQTGITDLTYLIPNLTNGTPYYIVVSATNAAGEGANSSQVSATPAVQPTTGGKLRLASHLVYSILKRPWQ